MTYEYDKGAGKGEEVPLKLLLMTEELRLLIGEVLYFMIKT